MWLCSDSSVDGIKPVECLSSISRRCGDQPSWPVEHQGCWLVVDLHCLEKIDDCVTRRQPKSCSLTFLFRRTRRDIWFLLQKPAKLQLICCVRLFYPDCHIQDALCHLTTLTHIQTLMHAFLYTLFYLWLSSVALSFDSWMLHTAWSVIVNRFLTYSSVAFLQFVTIINQ